MGRRVLFYKFFNHLLIEVKETDMSTVPKTITAGQTKDLASALIQAIPTNFPADVAQRWIGKKSELLNKIRKVLLEEWKQVTYSLDWRKAYEMLGMSNEYETADLIEFVISEQEGLWTVPVLKGLTCDKVVVALRKAGCKVYFYRDNLDEDVTKNDRDPNRDGTYVITFQGNIEADEENKNKSANQLQQSGHEGITLLERLLLELAYFLTTGGHLDVKNVTLCAGSRVSFGHVPYVDWDSVAREVFVDWCNPDYRGDVLRSRSIVSLPAEAR